MQEGTCGTVPLYQVRQARGALRRHLSIMRRKSGIPKPFQVIALYSGETEKGKPVFGFMVTFYNQDPPFPMTFEVAVYDKSCRVKKV